MINKITVLDKGYVAMLSSWNSEKAIQKVVDPIGSDYFKRASGLTLVIRCPLFVQLNLSKFNLKMLAVKDDDVDAYMPNEASIGCEHLEDSKAIADDIKRTTEALLLNPQSYQKDGCNTFISQLISPINIYTTLVVSGSYQEFQYFVESRLPEPIEQYRIVVSDILRAEWPNSL